MQSGESFTDAGWSLDAYEEHAAVMEWALSNDANGALNLRIPGLAKYTRDAVGKSMERYIAGSISIDELVTYVSDEWNQITQQEGKLRQLRIYRAALGLDTLDEVQLCRLHRDTMDEENPSTCRKYDGGSTPIILPSIMVPTAMFVIGLIVFIVTDKRRKKANYFWKIKLDELEFGEKAEIIGRGTFGLVTLAEYKGTQVAVKRVRAKESMPRSLSSRNLQISVMFDDSSDLESAQRDASGSFHRSFDASGSFQRDSCSVVGSRRKGWASFLAQTSKGDDYGRLEAEFVKEMRIMGNLRHPCITTVMG